MAASKYEAKNVAAKKIKLLGGRLETAPPLPLPLPPPSPLLIMYVGFRCIINYQLPFATIVVILIDFFSFDRPQLVWRVNYHDRHHINKIIVIIDANNDQNPIDRPQLVQHLPDVNSFPHHHYRYQTSALRFVRYLVNILIFCHILMLFYEICHIL